MNLKIYLLLEVSCYFGSIVSGQPIVSRGIGFSKRRQQTTILRCAKSQKSADHICTSVGTSINQLILVLLSLLLIVVIVFYNEPTNAQIVQNNKRCMVQA
jgi:hypothetical protein